MASDGCIVLWGWERDGRRGRSQNSFDYWAPEEQQPRRRGEISRMRLASTVFLSRHKSAVVAVFHSKLLTAVAVQSRRCSNH